MNVAVVYIDGNKTINTLATELARDARTHAITPAEFNHNETVDLLLLGFNCHKFNVHKELEAFIHSLDRNHVHNISLFGTYSFSDKQMNKAIKLCQNQDLPLMREQYTCKLPLFCKELPSIIIQDSRNYIQDMMTVVENYY